MPADPAQGATTAIAAPPTSAVAAGSASAASTAQSSSSNVNLDEIVCRNSAPATGTRLGGGRECHTVREWNQRQQDAQQYTRQQQVMGYTGSH